jgi:hypothetical protein
MDKYLKKSCSCETAKQFFSKFVPKMFDNRWTETIKMAASIAQQSEIRLFGAA